MTNIFYICIASAKERINNRNSKIKTMKKILLGIAACAVVSAMCACGSSNGLTEGNKSKTDTLSYALGLNIGYGMKYEFADVPFDVKTIGDALTAAALDKKTEQTHEESLNQLREYFMFKRGARAQEIAERRAEADSVRLAAGDSTVMEYPLADPEMFESEQERYDVSYAFGNDVGNNIKESGLPLQVYWLAKGLTEGFGGSGEMSEVEVNSYLQNYFMNVRPAEVAEKSQQWLEKVEKKWGVQKTESGLLYKIVKKGGEPQASDDRDVVVVRYEGSTREGKVFDSTYERVKELNEQVKAVKKDETLTDEQREQQLVRLDAQLARTETAEFPLNRVIKGWTEGMKLVGKGGKIILWIPSELAYGEYGAGRSIGPNEALKFVVEVVDVKPYEAPVVEEPAVEEPESADAE